jgi:hypothetical protein
MTVMTTVAADQPPSHFSAGGACSCCFVLRSVMSASLRPAKNTACRTEPSRNDGSGAADKRGYPFVYRIATINKTAITAAARAVHRLATLRLEPSPVSFQWGRIRRPRHPLAIICSSRQRLREYIRSPDKHVMIDR